MEDPAEYRVPGQQSFDTAASVKRMNDYAEDLPDLVEAYFRDHNIGGLCPCDLCQTVRSKFPELISWKE